MAKIVKLAKWRHNNYILSLRQHRQVHKLYSNRSRVMVEIIEDLVGVHDFLLTPCSQEMFNIGSGNNDHHPSCHENIVKAFADLDIPVVDVPTTFNIFMAVRIAPNGKIRIEAPLSKPGDYIIFEAKMDLLVALTACSDEQTNNYSLKPIAYEII